MTNNDILRRIRYIFDLSDDKMTLLSSTTNHEVTRARVCDWLKKDDDPALVRCSDHEFAVFLNGLIELKRGKQEGPARPAERELSNNTILRKLKIALNLRSEDIVETIELGGAKLSEHALSALFRKVGHRNYMVCEDQIMRAFLKGLQIQHRDKESDSEAAASKL